MFRRNRRATATIDELDSPRTKAPKRRKRVSLLGFLATVTGVAALLVLFRDRLGNLPYSGYLYEVKGHPLHVYQVAGVGLILSGLALFLKTITGRTRGGWAMLGLLLCGSAAGIYRYQTSDRQPGSPEYWVQTRIVEPIRAKLPLPQAEPVAPPPTATEVHTGGNAQRST